MEHLPLTSSFVFAAIAIAAFTLAYRDEVLGIFVIYYLLALMALAWCGSPILAFLLGLTIGLATVVPQAFFFQKFLGWKKASGLWLMLSMQIAAFLVLSQQAVTRWPVGGMFCIPFIWTALEYFRCELHPLKFPWLTPSLALSHPFWLPMARVGAYGWSFVAFGTMIGVMAPIVAPYPWVAAVSGGVFVAAWFSVLIVNRNRGSQEGRQPVRVVGIQFEAGFEDGQLKFGNVLGTLHDTWRRFLADVYVLPEYSLDGPPLPWGILGWCKWKKEYVAVGGKERLADGQFRNTTFVVGPDGEVAFKQAKCNPIPFVGDGLPARSQKLWSSPWGKIAVPVCYDLGFSRTMDTYIRLGAEAVIVPAMDLVEWGPYEHELHARLARFRAAEYGVPILRVASSGPSELIRPDGSVAARAHFGLQGFGAEGSVVSGELTPRRGSLPVDRAVVYWLFGLLRPRWLREITEGAANPIIDG